MSADNWREITLADLSTGIIERAHDLWRWSAKIALVLVGLGVFLWGISSLVVAILSGGSTPVNIPVPPGTSKEDANAIQFQHQIYQDDAGNMVYVYCDMPKMDRIYILADGHGHQVGISVVQGGCK